MKNNLLTLPTLMVIVLLGGCSLSPVQPWEKGLLAEKAMQVIPDDLEFQADEHIYFSREASSGGRSVGGGGCGCN